MPLVQILSLYKSFPLAGITHPEQQRPRGWSDWPSRLHSRSHCQPITCPPGVAQWTTSFFPEGTGLQNFKGHPHTCTCRSPYSQTEANRRDEILQNLMLQIPKLCHYVAAYYKPSKTPSPAQPCYSMSICKVTERQARSPGQQKPQHCKSSFCLSSWDKTSKIISCFIIKAIEELIILC